MDSLKIAIIGSGISGLSAAWLLSKKHQVTLYEAGDHFGGHANTATVQTNDGPVDVDTGFIVFNEGNYPNLTALFAHIGVESHETEMSLGISAGNGAYEFGSSGIGGFFGQRRNVFNPRHYRLLADMHRFFSTAPDAVKTCGPLTLGEFLTDQNYGDAFTQNYILPMGAAIWSTCAKDMLAFPARTFVDFYANHGLLDFAGHPLWRSVLGGSRRYVQRLLEDGAFETLKNTPIKKVVRHPGYVHIVDARGVIRPFDHVIIATHANHALDLLEAPDMDERNLLSAFTYQKNTAVLHRDPRWMPKRKSVWSSWNYMSGSTVNERDLCVTYWMNSLQKLPTSTNLFVTLNPYDEIHPKAVEATYEYDHPVFDSAAIAAQKHLWSLQGKRNTWFCGAHFGYGFHEDGLQSGLAVAEQLGGVRRPWTVANESGRIQAFTSQPDRAQPIAAAE